MGSGGELPAVANAAVDYLACDTEVWCMPSRTTLYRLSAGATRLRGMRRRRNACQEGVLYLL